MTFTRKLINDNGLQAWKTEHQAVTSCIVHLADSDNFKGVTFNKHCGGLTGSCFESPNDTIHVTVVFNSRQDTEVHKTSDRKNKSKMTDRVSIGQFTDDENVTASNHSRWTSMTGLLSAIGQHYCIRIMTTVQKEKRKSPRFAFLKISATAHCTHLQSRTSQPTGKTLQKSAIWPIHSEIF